jgi:DNA-directed RNA polymerase III subunit RPC7
MKIYPQPPATASERRLIQKRREHRTAMRNGPFFIDAPKTGKRDPSAFDVFEDQASYSNKRAKRSRGLPNLKKLPIGT